MISTEDLGCSKTCAHLVPQMLTDAHRNKKQSSLNFCTNMTQEMWVFLLQCVSVKETGIHYSEPESQQKSME